LADVSRLVDPRTCVVGGMAASHDNNTGAVCLGGVHTTTPQQQSALAPGPRLPTVPRLSAVASGSAVPPPAPPVPVLPKKNLILQGSVTEFEGQHPDGCGIPCPVAVALSLPDGCPGIRSTGVTLAPHPWPHDWTGVVERSADEVLDMLGYVSAEMKLIPLFKDNPQQGPQQSLEVHGCVFASCLSRHPELVSRQATLMKKLSPGTQDKPVSNFFFGGSNGEIAWYRHPVSGAAVASTRAQTASGVVYYTRC
jgi:hypothetical protein